MLPGVRLGSVVGDARRRLVRCAAVASVLSAASAGALHGQDVRVTVRAESSAGPVDGAQLSASGRGALTDADGSAILLLPAGSHVLSVTRIGFEAVELSLSLTAGRDTTVVVRLEEEAIEGEEILVVSTRTERRIEDEPLRIEVVSREEVEEKLLMTPGDISMLLNETAGLRVQPSSPALGGASVRIQGLRGRYTQILSDGLPLYGGQSGALGPLQIPPMDLGQVEVIKGAASALYGATALGGVVNLISRRPDDERELLVNQSTLGGTDGVLWLAGRPTERWGYTLLGGVHRQGRTDVDEDGWADLAGFRRVMARPRVFWDDGAGRSVFFTVGGMAEDREGGTMPGGTTPAGNTYRERLETRRLDGGVVAGWLLSDTRRLSARGSAMTQRHVHDFGGARERDRHRTAFGEVALSGQDGAHAWVIGAAVQHEGFEGREVTAFDFDWWVPGVFVQDEYAPLRSLTLSASARLDRHSTYGTFVSPRLSALIRPGPWVVRASVGTGYFAPSPFTEETEEVGLRRLLPFSDLDAERVVSAMLDVGREVGAWELNGTLFGSRVRDPLVVTADGGGDLTMANGDEPVPRACPGATRRGSCRSRRGTRSARWAPGRRRDAGASASSCTTPADSGSKTIRTGRRPGPTGSWASWWSDASGRRASS